MRRVLKYRPGRFEFLLVNFYIIVFAETWLNIGQLSTVKIEIMFFVENRPYHKKAKEMRNKSKTLKDMNENGNALFKSGRFREAQTVYTDAQWRLWSESVAKINFFMEAFGKMNECI